MDLFKLQGKVAIVTGGATTLGIGRSSILQLAQAGLSAVYATDLRDTHFELLKQDVAKVSQTCKVYTQLLDAGDEEGTKKLCQRVIQEQGRLDIFVANAGFVDMNNLWATELTDFTRSHATMVIGPYLAIKYGSQAMAITSPEKPAAKGSIIVIGSIASVTGGCGSPAYTAAKHAALGLARRGAIELSGTQIRVNCVGPGVTRTALWQNSRDVGAIKNDEPEGYHGQRDPDNINYIQQISEPDEIGNVVTFLASDLSTSVNAQMILADRGHLEACDMSWTSQATYCGIQQPPALFP